MITRPNLQIYGVEGGTKMQTKDTKNLFNEIDNFPSLWKEVDIKVHKTFRRPNQHGQEITSLCHGKLKCHEYRTKTTGSC
jgi:hypothetical protein